MRKGEIIKIFQLLYTISVLHLITSFALLVSFYQLKVRCALVFTMFAIGTSLCKLILPIDVLETFLSMLNLHSSGIEQNNCSKGIVSESTISVLENCQKLLTFFKFFEETIKRFEDNFRLRFRSSHSNAKKTFLVVWCSTDAGSRRRIRTSEE